MLLVAVAFTEATADSEEELDAFEFVEPILEGGVEFCGWDGCTREWAGWSQGACGDGAIACE